MHGRLEIVGSEMFSIFSLPSDSLNAYDVSPINTVGAYFPQCQPLVVQDLYMCKELTRLSLPCSRQWSVLTTDLGNFAGGYFFPLLPGPRWQAMR